MHHVKYAFFLFTGECVCISHIGLIRIWVSIYIYIYTYIHIYIYWAPNLGDHYIGNPLQLLQDSVVIIGCDPHTADNQLDGIVHHFSGVPSP